jgi:putative addiction module component (TIGR02574 family)
VLVEDAIQLYLEASAITDLDSSEVAETQLALIGELDLPWLEEELTRRKNNLKQNPDSGLSWDEVKRRVRARHGR